MSEIIDKITHFSQILLTLSGQPIEQHSFYEVNTHYDLVLSLLWQKKHCIQIDWNTLYLILGTTRIVFEIGPTNAILKVSTIQYTKNLQSEGAEGYLVFVNKTELKKTSNQNWTQTFNNFSMNIKTNSQNHF
jgi:hypothetical protein